MNKFIKYLLIFYSCVPFVAPTSQSCCCFKKTKVAPSPAPKAQAKPAVEVFEKSKKEVIDSDHRYSEYLLKIFSRPRFNLV